MTTASWSKLKAQIGVQKQTDPQRAVLCERAISAVEEGLRHLESVGFPFELLPRGTMAEAVAAAAPGNLSLEKANQLLTAPAVPVDTKFDALGKPAHLN